MLIVCAGCPGISGSMSAIIASLPINGSTLVVPACATSARLRRRSSVRETSAARRSGVKSPVGVAILAVSTLVLS